MSIHPTAIVSPLAQLGKNVSVGPYAIIEEDVEIGDETVIEAAAQLRSGSRIGKRCTIGSGAIISSDPQSLGFDPKIRSCVRVGDGNLLREHVTLHRSVEEGGETIIGNENFLMAGAHVGHDSIVGDHNVIANNVLLGGFVQLGSHCFLGGASGFHQFVRVGDYVITQGNSGFSLDLPPYVMGSGINLVSGINAIGLRRGGFSSEERAQIKEAFRSVFRSGNSLAESLQEVEGRELSAPVAAFYTFLQGKSKCGICIRTPKKKENL